MTLVHLQIEQVSKYIFFENSDLKKIHNEDIVFQKSLTINTAKLTKFIEDILFDNQFKDKKFQKQEKPPDFHGDILSDGITQLNLKEEFRKMIVKEFPIGSNTYKFFGVGIDIHTGDIFTRMKDKETGEETGPITKSNPRDYNGNIKDNGNIEVKYRCTDSEKSSIIKLNFHIKINEEYEYKSSKDDFTKQLKEMFGDEKDSFIKKHENYIIELSNMSILNFKSISNKPMALNLKKMSFYISQEIFEKQFKGPHNNFPKIDKKDIFIGSNIYRLNGNPIYFPKGPNSAKSYIELKYLRSPLFSDDLDDLIYQPIEGDGDCLYKVIALYCGRDQEKLQAEVNKEMKTKEIKNSNNANTIINELMQLLKRPIMIVNSKDRKISNLKDLDNNRSLFECEPIFLYYTYTEKRNHYDALILRNPNISGVDIFSKLMQNDKKPSVTQAEVTIQCEIIFDERSKYKYIECSKKWFDSQINIKLKELDAEPQIFRVAENSVDTILGSYKELRTHEETLETKKIEMLKFFKEKMKKTKDTPLTYQSNDETIKEEQIIEEFSSCRIL